MTPNKHCGFLLSGVTLFVLLHSRPALGTENPPLVGCDAINCTPGPFVDPVCNFGNISSFGVGIANLSTVISPEPLTWTVSFTSWEGATLRDPNTYSRAFWLGTPPSLKLDNSISTTGCALVFEEVSSRLNFSKNGSSTEVGTRSDALTPMCVTDLLSQARIKLSGILAQGNTSDICAELGASLNKNAPRSCNASQNGSWGKISAKEITGSNAPPRIPEGSCHPSTGKNYAISLVDTYNITGNDSSTVIDPFADSITPIMTAFFSSGTGDQEKSGTLDMLDVGLTCMKIADSQDLSSPNVQSGVSNLLLPDLGTAAMVFVIGVAIVIF